MRDTRFDPPPFKACCEAQPPNHLDDCPERRARLERENTLLHQQIGRLGMGAEEERTRLEDMTLAFDTAAKRADAAEARLREVLTDALAELSRVMATPAEGYEPRPSMLRGDIARLVIRCMNAEARGL